MAKPYDRISPSSQRGVITGTAAIVALAWLVYVVDRRAWPRVALPIVVSALGALNVAITLWQPRLKRRTVRLMQRHVLNPMIRALLRLRLNPMGVMLLQTRGRRSGQHRLTPVGAGARHGEVWVVAEHGRRAAYVANLEADPRIRVMITRLGRRHWHHAIATIEPDDDVLARQHWIAGWNPLRWLNVALVRCLGAEMTSVRIVLLPATSGVAAEAAAAVGKPEPLRGGLTGS